MRKVFQSILLSLVITSCNIKESNLKIRETNIILSANKSFSYDVKNRLNVSYLENRNNEFIFFMDKKTSLIEKYKINKNKLEQISKVSIRDLFHLKNSVPESISVLSEDSLLIASRDNNSICITDYSFKNNKFYSLDYNGYVIHSFSQPIYFHKNLLYMLKTPPINIFSSRTNLSEYYKNSPGIIFDVNKQKVYTENISKYPENINESNTYQVFNPYTCIDGIGNYVFTYGPLNEIYVYNVDGKLIGTHSPESKYYKEPEPFPTTSLGDDKFTYKYIITNGTYKDIIYDRYRNVYFRVYMLPSEDQFGSILPSPAEKEWSLMMLSSDFSIISEQKMNNKYDPNTIIVTKNGILISENRFMSESYSSKRIDYRLFEIK